MTSTRKKGIRVEIRCQKQLESEGYTVFFRSHTIKCGPIFRGYDFADLFDVIAVRLIEMRGFNVLAPEWLFISDKTHNSSGLGQHKDSIKAFAEKWGLHNMRFELWRWKKPNFYGRGKARAWCKGEFERIPL